jgi:type II secretory pathway component PulM
MSATGFWDRRTAGERRTIAIAGVVLAAAAAIAGWVEIERSRARLDAELPHLRASIASLERDAEEVKRLRLVTPDAASAATVRGPSSTQLATLATQGGGLAGAQITILDDKRVKVAGGDVAFGALLEWLRNAQVTHAMRVESARIEALAAAGRVRAELTLTRS